MTWKDLYSAAHRRYQGVNYPSSTKDFGWLSTSYPQVTKANGLTRAIINHLTWSGHYANRVSSAGRLAPGLEKQASGAVLTVKKFIPSTTKRGTADIHAIINGKHISIEVKIGRDHMSDHQVKEQQRIERAGGIYLVVKTIEGWFEEYEKLVTLQ